MRGSRRYRRITRTRRRKAGKHTTPDIGGKSIGSPGSGPAGVKNKGAKRQPLKKEHTWR